MFLRMERVNEGGTLRQMLFAAMVTRMMLVVQRFFLWRELSNAGVLKDVLSSLCTHECAWACHTAGLWSTLSLVVNCMAHNGWRLWSREWALCTWTE